MNRPLRRLTLGLLAAAGFVLAAGSARAQERRFYEDVPSAFRDIASVGTSVHGVAGHQSGAFVDLGFTFTLYDQQFTQVSVTTNGYLCFDGTVNPVNDAIPTTYPPNGLIAPFWSDLDMRPNPKALVLYERGGKAPNRYFVAQWSGLAFTNDPTSNLNFQVVLFEANSEIQFHYAQMLNGDGTPATGANATVGIKSLDGTKGVQVGYNQPGVLHGKGFAFSVNSYAVPEGRKLGDLNGDGVVNILDQSRLVEITNPLYRPFSAVELLTADIAPLGSAGALSGSGKVDLADRDLMSQVIVGKVKLGPYLAGGPEFLTLGQPATLTGSGFDTTSGAANTVICMGTGNNPIFVNADSVNGTGTQVTFTVPMNARRGPLFVISQALLSNPRLANIQSVPSIIAANPTPGVQGEDLALSGVSFPQSVSDATVTVAGVTAVVKSVTPAPSPGLNDTLVVTVPSGFSPGNVPIVLSYVSSKASSEPFMMNVGQRPIAQITAPANGDVVTDRVSITGTASSPNFASYLLELAPAGGDFATVGSGTTPVVAGQLGTYDPTILLNGYYQLRLTVTDTLGITAQAMVGTSIQGTFKVGQYTLRYVDLELPTTGIAIQVVREWDGRDKFPRDFGVGWSQKWVTVNLQKPNFTEGVAEANYNVTLENPYSTSVEYRFAPVQLNPFDPYYTAAFKPTDSNERSSIDFETPDTVAAGNHDLFKDGVGNYFWFPEAVPFDPQVYRITEVDGTVLRVEYKAGLLQVTKANGASLTFTHTGIVSSTGQSVTFTRDPFDRISAITDPKGNVQRYAFDNAGNLIQHTDPLGFASTYSYDSKHNLTSYKNAAGVQVERNEYDDAGRLVATTDPFGNKLVFSHDLDGHREVTYDKSGRPTITEYDAKGRTTKVTGPDGLFEQYTLNDQNRVVARLDRAGKLWSYEYDPATGNKTAQVDPEGRRTEWTYGAFGAITSTKDPDGGVAVFTYDPQGNLLTEQDPAGGLVKKTWDNKGNLKSITDERNQTTSYTYDPDTGFLSAISLPSGETILYGTDANGNITTESKVTPSLVGGAPTVATTTYAYDAANRRTSITRPDGTAEVLAYGDGGTLAERTETGGVHERYGYDAMNRLTQRLRDDGKSETIGYDKDGNVTSITGLTGTRTATVDVHGQPTTITFADGTTLGAEYDSVGRVSARTDARGQRWTFGRDGTGWITTETDPQGGSISYVRNGKGQVLSKTDADHRLTVYTYDAAGRLLTTTYPDGSVETLVRDLAGNVTQKTDVFGRVTTYSYQNYGDQNQAAVGASSYSYARDPQGRIASATDPLGNTTGYQYDPTSGKRTGVTLPMGLTSSATWSGEVATTLVDFDGRITTQSFDGRNNLTFRALPDGSGERIEYTASGKRIQLLDGPLGQTRFAYDSQERLLKRTESDGRTLAYGYDAGGNVQQIQSPAGTLALGHDAYDRITSVTDVQTQTTTFAFTPGGMLKTITRPNGVRTDLVVDLAGRVKSITHSNAGGVIASYAYDYDQYGQRKHVTESTGRTVVYGYDDFGRLTSEAATVAGVTTSTTYVYDPAGNRSTKTVTRPDGSTQTTTYSYDPNSRLLAEAIADSATGLSAVTYSWDNSGHLLERDRPGETLALGYDGVGRLTSAVVTRGAQQSTVLYRYDYLNNLVHTVRDGVATNHLVDSNRLVSQVVADTDYTTGAVTASYAYGNTPVSVTTSGGTFYFLADGQASTRLVVDSSGNVVAAYDFDAFGLPTSSSGNTGVTDVQYAGERVDPTTGLVQLRSRWLDPRTGRFTTRDTFEGFATEPQTRHPYIYAQENPVTQIDPLGTFEADIGCLLTIDMPAAIASIEGPADPLGNLKLHRLSLAAILSNLNVFIPDALDLINSDADLLKAFALVQAALTGSGKSLLNGATAPSRATSAFLYGTTVFGRMGSDLGLAIAQPPGAPPPLSPAQRLSQDQATYAVDVANSSAVVFNQAISQLPLYKGMLDFLNPLVTSGAIRDLATFAYQVDGNGNKVGFNHPNVAFTVAATSVRWNIMLVDPNFPTVSENQRILTNDPRCVAIDLRQDASVQDFTQAMRSGGDFGSPVPFILSFQANSTGQSLSPQALSPVVIKEAIPQRSKPAGIGTSTVQIGVGVMAHSGEFVLSRTDLKVGGRGIDLEFTRTYRSGLIYPETSTLHTNFHLGHNWSFAHDRRLGNSGGGQLIDMDPVGRISDTYNQTLTGTAAVIAGSSTQAKKYSDPPGVFSSVSQTSVRYRWLPSGATTPVTTAERGYLCRQSNGLLEGYNGAGWLVWQQDRCGNTIEHLRDENYLLQTTYDTLGRRYDYVYTQLGGHNLIQQIIDRTGNRTVNYAYDPLTLDLLSVTSPAGRKETYEYSTGFVDPALNHNMTKVYFPENPTTPAIVNVYKNDGPGSVDYDSVISQTYGLPSGTQQTITGVDGSPAVAQTVGGTYQFQFQDVNPFALNNDTNLIATRTVLTDRRGASSVYELNRQGNPINVYDETSALTHHDYNTDGMRTHTKFPNGHEEYLGYDTNNPISGMRMNLIYQAQFPAPGDPSSAVVTEFDYDPVFNQLRRVSDTEAFLPVTLPPPAGIDARTWLTPSPLFDRYTVWNSFDYEEGAEPGIPVGLALNFGYTWTDIMGDRNGLGVLQAPGPTGNRQWSRGPVGALTAPAGPSGKGQTGAYLPPRWNLSFNKGDLNHDGVVGVTTQFSMPNFGLVCFGLQLAGPNGQPITTLLDYGPPSGHGNKVQSRGHLTADSYGVDQPNVTYFQFNAAGQITKKVEPLGVVTSTEFYPDGAGYDPTTGAQPGLMKRSIADDQPFPATPRGVLAAPVAAPTLVEYDPYGNVRKVTDPIGCSTESVYDADGLMLERRRGTNDPSLSYHTYYTFDGNRRLTKVRVEDKGSTNPNPDGWFEQRIAYDLIGDPVQEGKKLWAADGSSSQWLVTGYAYDEEQDRTLATFPEGNQTKWEFDARKLVQFEHRGFGTADESVTRYDYDPNRNLVKVTLPPRDSFTARTIQYVFDAFNRPKDAVAPDGSLTRKLYDAAGQLQKTQRWGTTGGATPLGNDPGVLAANVLLEESTLVRDERRRVTQEQHSLFGPTIASATATFSSTFDPLDRLSQRIDPEGRKVVFTLDGLGRVLTSVDDAGNTVATTYDLNGNVLTTTETELASLATVAQQVFTTTNTYDSLSRLTSTKDSAGQKTTFQLDSRDNVVHAFDALGSLDGQGSNNPGNPMHYVFDSVGRLIESQDELRQGGAGTGALDTTNQYNPDGLIRLQTRYDRNSRRIALLDDNGATTSYVYDSLDRNTQEVYADGTRTVFSYSKDDTIATILDPNGSKATRRYDVANRLTQVDVSQGSGVVGVVHEEYQYDGLGRLTHCMSTDGASRPEVDDRVYDSFSRMLQETQNGRVVGATFSLNGKRLSLGYPNGRQITYAYDLIDRQTGISDAGGTIATTDFMGTGRPLRRTLGNGTVLNFADDPQHPTAASGYDSARRVVALKHHTSSANAFVNRAYGYDRTNRRTFEQRIEDGGLTDTYTHDSAHRITDVAYDTGVAGAARRTNAQVHYGLDGVGNRRQVQDTDPNGTATNVSYGVNSLNEYTTVGGVTRTYSTAGELTSDGRLNFAYDYRHRLVTVTRVSDGGRVATYAYDCENRRTQKTVFDPVTGTPTVTRFVYDNWREIAEETSTQTTLVTYVHGPIHVDDAIQITRTSNHPLGAAVLYLHQDARANVTAVSDASGNVVERRIYDDYGVAYDPATKQAPLAGSTVGNPFAFQGRYYDPETGLFQFRDRFYDPYTGRFLTRDPVLDPKNLGNQYTFGGSDPATMVDPTGDFLFIFLMYMTAGFGYGFTNSIISDLDHHRPLDIQRALNEGYMGALLGAKFAAEMISGFGMLANLAKLAESAVGNFSDGIKTGNWGSIKDGLVDLGHLAASLIPGPVGDLVRLGMMVIDVAGAVAAGGMDAVGSMAKSMMTGGVLDGAGDIESQFEGSSFENCFLKGTLVEAEHGRITIEQIRAGDRVWSSPDRGDGSLRELREVKRLFRNVTAEVAYVTVGVVEDEEIVAASPREARSRSRSAEKGGGESADEPPSSQTIRCTPGHPWFVAGRGWSLAGSLKGGDRLVGFRGERLAVLEVDVRHETAETFNFEVEGDHTYFVGCGARAAWVHNKSHSEILADNLLLAKQIRPSGTAAHHIVAWDDPRAGGSRGVLARAGIGIDEAVNGVFLPRGSRFPGAKLGVTPHSRVHTSRYYRELERELRLAERGGNVRGKLNEIAARLTAGTFPYKMPKTPKRRRK